MEMYLTVVVCPGVGHTYKKKSCKRNQMTCRTVRGWYELGLQKLNRWLSL